MRRRRRRTRATGSACQLCLGSGRVPYADNRLALWMVPCRACRGG